VDINPLVGAVYAANPLTYPESVLTVSSVYEKGCGGSVSIDPNTQNVYVTCGNAVQVLNERTGTEVIETIQRSDGADFADDTDTGKVYVANDGTPSMVSVIDEKTNTITATLTVGNYVNEIAVDSKRDCSGLETQACFCCKLR
jgi:YVTN family beta-propeller protein